MYPKGLTSNCCLPGEAPGSVEALSSPVLVLDGGGVCSSRADELATLALSSQTKVPALACLISSSYVCESLCECMCVCVCVYTDNCK